MMAIFILFGIGIDDMCELIVRARVGVAIGVGVGVWGSAATRNMMGTRVSSQL